MLRPDKVEMVRAVAEKLGRAQSVVLADFRGLTVEQMTDLRGRFRERQVEFKVIKNRLGKRAVAEAGCESLDEFLRGNTGWAFGIEDPTAPAKILAEFAKENESLTLKGGLLEGKRIDVAMIERLAKIPSRPELLAQLAGGLKAPAVKMATVFEAALVRLARGFGALAEKLEAAQSGGG